MLKKKGKPVTIKKTIHSRLGPGSIYDLNMKAYKAHHLFCKRNITETQ